MRLFGFHFRDPGRSLERKIRRKIKQSVFGDIKSKFHGTIGEEVVSFSISSCFNSNSRTLKNTYLHFNNGHTTQVDEIVFSSSGIYVFEVKNYKGWIFGHQDNRNWTQVLNIGYGDTEKNYFYNPIRQNQTHIRCIRNIIKDSSVPIHSVVVFTDKSVFKSLTYDQTQVSVIHRFELQRTIRHIEDSFFNSIPEESIEALYNLVLSNSLSSDSQGHIEQVNYRKNNPNDEGTWCPRCGAKLVIRTSKKGTPQESRFYGCSSFPRCRYTRIIW